MVAYCYFLSFLFLIVVVLMNLLNGLAVSDTGDIKADATKIHFNFILLIRANARAGCPQEVFFLKIW